MSYETRFSGQFRFDRALSPEHRAYLVAFSQTRRMRRDPDATAKRPDPLREAAGLPVGPEGGYFVGAGGTLGQEGGGPLFGPGGAAPEALGIVDFNSPPESQPHLWCCWAPDAAGTALCCPEPGAHYEYVTWLRYLIERFITRWGYSLSGEVEFQGAAQSDKGRIVVGQGQVVMKREGGPGPSGEGAAAFERGSGIFEAKRFPEALVLLEQAAARAPSWADPLWMKGLALGRLGREEAGLAALDAALALEADPAMRASRRRKLQSILRALGRGGQGLERGRKLRAESRFAEAMEEYEAYLAALAEAGGAGDALLDGQLGLGMCCQGLGRHEEALQRFEAAIAAAPQDANGWFLKASLLAYQLGRHADAAAAFRKVMELGGENAQLWTELGLCLRRCTTLREAAQAFEKAIAADGRCALAWYNLGNVLLEGNVPKGALDCFEHAVALNDPRCLEPARKGMALAQARLTAPS